MRHIQFTQPFAQQFGEVVVVVDVGQELTVGGRHLVPVHAVHVQVVETLLFLFIDMVKHIGTLFGQVQLHFSTVGDGFQLVALGIHLLHTAST